MKEEEKDAVMRGAIQHLDVALNPDGERREYVIAVVVLSPDGTPTVMSTVTCAEYQRLFAHIAQTAPTPGSSRKFLGGGDA